MENVFYITNIAKTIYIKHDINTDTTYNIYSKEFTTSFVMELTWNNIEYKTMNIDNTSLGKNNLCYFSCLFCYDSPIINA